VIPAGHLGRWRGALVATLLVCGWLPCSFAFAQGRSQRPASSSGTTQAPGWSFYIGTDGTFESNPNFQAPPNDLSDFSGGAGGGFAYSLTGARGTLSLSGNGRALFYRELTDLNSFTFGGTLSGGYRLGPQTQLMFNGTVSSDYTRRSEILLSQGIVLPQSQVLTMRFNTSLAHSFSTRTSVSASARFEKAQFDSSSLNDGQTFGAAARLSQRLSETASLSIGYAHDESDSEVLKQSIDTAYGGARFLVNPKLDIEMNAGASSVGGSLGARKVTPYGSAAINLKNPRLNLSLGYSHLVRQEYGVGVLNESDLASFSLSRAFGRRNATFSASVNYGFNRSSRASLQDYSYRTSGATAGLQVPMGRRFRADAGYSYYRTSQVLFIDSHSAFVALSYWMDVR
jgi:hypothetical protein